MVPDGSVGGISGGFRFHRGTIFHRIISDTGANALKTSIPGLRNCLRPDEPKNYSVFLEK